MPRIPGTGVYEQPAPDVITATTIESTVYNAFVNDVETDLNLPRPITSGGTGANTAADATTNLKAVSYGGAQTLTDAEKLVARTNIAAVPFDAMAYSGMQVNGGITVNQENPASTLISTHLAYICDGWVLSVIGPVVVAQQGVALASLLEKGFSHYLAVDTTTAKPTLAAGDMVNVLQRIEGYRIVRLGWGSANATPITIGFWAFHSRTGTFSISVKNIPATHTYVATYTQNAAGTLEYKTVTIPGPTVGVWGASNTGAISIAFNMGAGTTNTAPSANTWIAGNFFAAPGQVNCVATTTDSFHITGVVVLPGTQAPTAAQSPLIMRPFDQELVTCQRYFEQYAKLYYCAAFANSAIAVRAVVPYLQKRAAPTVTLSGTFGFNTAGTIFTLSAPAPVTAEASGQLLFQAATSGATSGQGGALIDIAASLIKIDARL